MCETFVFAYLGMQVVTAQVGTVGMPLYGNCRCTALRVRAWTASWLGCRKCCGRSHSGLRQTTS